MNLPQVSAPTFEFLHSTTGSCCSPVVLTCSPPLQLKLPAPAQLGIPMWDETPSSNYVFLFLFLHFAPAFRALFSTGVSALLLIFRPPNGKRLTIPHSYPLNRPPSSACNQQSERESEGERRPRRGPPLRILHSGDSLSLTGLSP